jgi:hypothetical protein
MRTMLQTILPNDPAEAVTIIDNCFATADLKTHLLEQWFSSEI